VKLIFPRMVCVIFTLFLSIPLAGAITLFTPERLLESKPLTKKQGYLLIDLDVNGSAPSLVYQQLSARDQKYLAAGQQARLLGKEKTMDLKDKPAGFYLAKIPAGLYQITRVNAPYFNLPFRVDTSSRREWRFSIEPGQINYIGKLVIDKKRSTQYVDIDLVNRIATNKADIENQLSTLLENFPLRLGVGVRDDFLTSLSDEQGQ